MNYGDTIVVTVLTLSQLVCSYIRFYALNVLQFHCWPSLCPYWDPPSEGGPRRPALRRWGAQHLTCSNGKKTNGKDRKNVCTHENNGKAYKQMLTTIDVQDPFSSLSDNCLLPP